MNKRFQTLVEDLESQCQELLTMTPVAAQDVPSETPAGGIYLFSEGSSHLYTGRIRANSGLMRINDANDVRPSSAHPWAYLSRRG